MRHQITNSSFPVMKSDQRGSPAGRNNIPGLETDGSSRGAKGDSELINLSPGLCLQSRFMSFIFGLRNEHAGTLNRERLRSRVMVRIARYILKLPASLKTAVCGTTSGIEVQRDRWLHLHWPGINNT